LFFCSLRSSFLRRQRNQCFRNTKVTSCRALTNRKPGPDQNQTKKEGLPAEENVPQPRRRRHLLMEVWSIGRPRRQQQRRRLSLPSRRLKKRSFIPEPIPLPSRLLSRLFLRANIKPIRRQQRPPQVRRAGSLRPRLGIRIRPPRQRLPLMLRTLRIIRKVIRNTLKVREGLITR
jgi:hypothetical protein